MSKFIRWVLYAGAAAILILGFVVLYLFYMPHDSVGGKAEFSLAAMELYQEFVMDEEASNRKYIGKVVQVSGAIGEMTRDEKGSPVIIFRDGDDPFAG